MNDLFLNYSAHIFAVFFSALVVIAFVLFWLTSTLIQIG